MPRVNYNAQSFAIDGRRVWVVGASIHYARVDSSEWADRIASARQAGFNTIETPCPWMLHEPRKGRYVFQDGTDIKRFVELCGEQGMWVILRAGPFIGSGYDGGGIPTWLMEMPDIALREANGLFLERAGKYLRRLVTEVSDLQVTQDGPILLVQSEHGWTCSNAEQSEKYLNEITRTLRENGISVPILSANDLWAETTGTVDTWSGWEDMLSNVRQLRLVQPDAPRLVSAFKATTPAQWSTPFVSQRPPSDVVRHFAEILAAGGQPIVSPFHGGTNFGFLGGQLPGVDGGPVLSSVAPDAPLGEAGARTQRYQAIRRLATFASSFGHVFADLDPDYQPITLETTPSVATGQGKSAQGFSVIPLRGVQGRIVFVFANGSARKTVLLLDSGVRMPIDLGKESVGWFILEADMLGRGRLDYANLCPLAMAGRSTVIMFGPERAAAYISVDGSALHETVPSGRKPLVVEHRGVTFVICNQTQVDHAYHDGSSVYIGIDGFGLDGEPRPARGFPQVTIVDPDGEVSNKKIPGGSASGAKSGAGRTSTRRAIGFKTWRAAPAEKQIFGNSPRYATLDGPKTLAACGAGTGYGWYRIKTKVKTAAKQLYHLPHAADRLHLFVDGESEHMLGRGPGAEAGPIEMKLSKGEHTLVFLADNQGRSADGNDLLQHKGLFGHAYEVKAMRSEKPRRMPSDPVDPFAIRGWINGLTKGQLSDVEQLVWSFTHARKSPILLDIHSAQASGTIVLNDVPYAYYAGGGGAAVLRVLLEPGITEGFKRGKNEVRFAPDPHQDDPIADIQKHAMLYECVGKLSEGEWAFAKWEAPADSAFKELSKTDVRTVKGTPCWWKATFAVDDLDSPLWIDTTGMSKGQVFVNGQNLSRYFTARADGRAVGSQTRLYLPSCWVHVDEPNEIILFDEHGFDPAKMKLVRGETGEHEEA